MDLSALATQLAKLRESSRELREKLHKVLESKSWKLTRPLRHLGSRLRHEKVADIAAEEDAFDAAAGGGEGGGAGRGGRVGHLRPCVHADRVPPTGANRLGVAIRK